LSDLYPIEAQGTKILMGVAISYTHGKNALQKSQRLNIGGDGSQVDSLEVGSNAC